MLHVHHALRTTRRRNRHTLAEFHFGSRCAGRRRSAPHSRDARATGRRRARRALEHRFARRRPGSYRDFELRAATATTCSRACSSRASSARTSSALTRSSYLRLDHLIRRRGLSLLAARLELPRRHHRGRGRSRALSALQRRPLQRGRACRAGSNRICRPRAPWGWSETAIGRLRAVLPRRPQARGPDRESAPAERVAVSAALRPAQPDVRARRAGAERHAVRSCWSRARPASSATRACTSAIRKRSSRKPRAISRRW